MYALFLVLNKTDKLDDILEIFYQLKVGATTIDSIGMGRVLLEHNIHANIFASLRNILNEDKPYNKTIISVINDKEILEKAVKQINDMLDLNNKKGNGFLFVMPVLQSYGGWEDNN